MSRNHHLPVPWKAPLHSAFVNAPLSALDSALVDHDTRLDTLDNVRDGDAAWLQLNVGDPGALTIANGVISTSRSYHTVETEGLAAADNLDTISGVASDVLVLRTVSANRVVTVRHNVGNIYLADATNRALDDPNRPLLLVYNGTKWVERYLLLPPLASREVLDSAIVDTSELRWPDNALLSVPDEDTAFELALLPGIRARRVVQFTTIDTTIENFGMGTFTFENRTTVSATDSTYATYFSNAGGAPNQDMGIFNAGVDYRPQWNPVVDIVFITGSNIGIETDHRLWIGLFSGDPMAADDPAGLHLVAFRYSPQAGDVGWVGCVKDGTTLNVSETVAAIAGSSLYRLRIRYDNALGIAYFSVNEGAEVELLDNLPGATQNLNFYCEERILIAGGRHVLIARGSISTT